MRIQICNSALILVVGVITMLAGAASGRGVFTDDDVATKLDAISEGIDHRDLQLHHNDDELRVDKIVRGTKVLSRRLYPYMALVESQETKTCGGALIDKNWVLTAAHCVYQRTHVNVTLGTVDRTSISRRKGTQIILVDHVIPHDDYDDERLHHDIALLRLKKPATFEPNGYVRAARLPGPGTTFDGICKTAGWGRTSDIDKQTTRNNNLIQMEMLLTTMKECKSKLHKFSWDWDKDDTHSICAKGANSASLCYGDSGGPLMCYDDNTGHDYLAGVLSWGADTCDSHKPDVFMKVSEYREWIMKKTSI